MAVSMKVTNMSHTIGEREEGTDLTFLLSPPSSEEEEEALREAERRAEREAEREAEKRLGDRYEQPEGSGKAPTDPDVVFMQMISDMLASQRTMSQSLAQVADRLAMIDIPGTQGPHAAHGNSGAGSRPQSPTRTYTSA
jgi:hypothetical protein